MPEVILGMRLFEDPCAEHRRPYRPRSVVLVLQYHSLTIANTMHSIL